MRRQVSLFLYIATLILMILSSGGCAAAFAFSESDFVYRDDENPIMGMDPALQGVKQHYRPLNKPRAEKRYYCGVNIDCTSKHNGAETKQGTRIKKF